MGVTHNHDAKYYLEPTFDQDTAADRLALKKKYKLQIRNEIQYYLDKKNITYKQNMPPARTIIP